MPVNLKKHKRRGFTYIEMMISIIVFTLGFIGFLTIIIQNVNTQAKLQSQIEQKMDIDFLVEMMQTDIKSARSLEVLEDTKLQIITSDDLVILYEVKNYMLRRNEEVVLRYVLDSAFTPGGGDSVGVYMEQIGGEVIDVTFCR